jgi:hypothetical protein
LPTCPSPSSSACTNEQNFREFLLYLQALWGLIVFNTKGVIKSQQSLSAGAQGTCELVGFHL